MPGYACQVGAGRGSQPLGSASQRDWDFWPPPGWWVLEIKRAVFGVSISIQVAVDMVLMGHGLGAPFGAQTIGCPAGVAGSHTIVYT